MKSGIEKFMEPKVSSTSLVVSFKKKKDDGKEQLAFVQFTINSGNAGLEEYNHGPHFECKIFI